MSKKLKTLTYLLVIGLLVACQPNNTKDFVLLSGKIINPGNISYVTVKGNNYSYDIDMNADGTFYDTLRVDQGYYLFYSGRERTNVFLDHGYEISLELDQELFDETLQFTGEGNGTTENNYLANKARLDEEMTIDFQTLFSKEEDGFVEILVDWKSKMNDLLDQSAIQNKSFVEIEKRNINYEYLTQFANYEYYHQFATKDFSYRVPAEFNQHLSNIDLANEVDFILLSNYKRLLQAYFGAMMERGEIGEAFSAIKQIPSEVIREDLVPDYSRKVQPGNENAEAIYEGIISITSDSLTHAKLTEKIAKIRKLQKGMASPSFAFESIEGETVSLSDLRGSYVYIDVWATWCGPCLREIPALKQLESDYHDASVAFVSISIDEKKDYEKWQSMVASKELSGIQLYADNSWQSDFVKAYAIDGIPRFIVLDTEGNIIDPNAARPSDPQIRELLQSLVSNS
ncbi:MAG: TlpA disulfide reductase family protein [Reichenbachiella sp.]|uniref:TlpA family protein disulfide reductase n=1 Tax=Reichenbachiella sp. TaxID=2184521 RepID=UPI003265BEC6